jgi:endoglucanase
MSRSFTRFTILSALVLPIALSIAGCKKKQTGPSSASPASAGATANGKQPFPDSSPIVEPGTPGGAPSNPLLGAKLFVDPESLSMLQANRYRVSDPAKAALLDKIAQQPQALWMGDWNSNIFRAVEHYVSRAKASGAVPVMIAYNVPNRDCGQYSKGGMSSKEGYQRWIRNVAAGIGQDAAVVVLEPDALGHFQECLSDEQKAERLALLNDAVRVLRQNPSAAVYLDAGHPRWQPADEMAKRLKAAGVEYANGFSLNVSNYIGTEECLTYGHKVSELLGGKHFVIDTSRNGAGPYEQAKTEEEKWCNPPGRKIGLPPTTDTKDGLCDGFLWLKRPGESDGECNGGPKAGVFWLEQALQMAQ